MPLICRVSGPLDGLLPINAHSTGHPAGRASALGHGCHPDFTFLIWPTSWNVASHTVVKAILSVSAVASVGVGVLLGLTVKRIA